MTYVLLGQDLHEIADRTKKWFVESYGAKHFLQESEVMAGLSLKPTWQARLQTGYTLCVNVQPSPFSESLNQFVNQCAVLALPIKLWVAVPGNAQKSTFNSDLKQARSIGVGVVQFFDNGTVHESHRAVPLSLFALARAEPKSVPRTRREVIKNAEDTFLDGTPDQGCQAICQELELITRQFAEATYSLGFWRSAAGGTLSKRFFAVDSWAKMLAAMEQRLDTRAVRRKADNFSIHTVVRTRAFTDWRNEVSHRPKSLNQLKARDAKLRTMFEATRHLLLEWYQVSKPFGLLR